MAPPRGERHGRTRGTISTPMQAKRTRPLVTIFVLSVLVTVALLVAWVLYIVRSSVRIGQLAGRVGVPGEGPLNWLLLAAGCVLFSLLIAGLSYQLAQALAARRYLLKQDEFLSNITHELKSPLAAIRLHAQTLEHPDLANEARRRSTRFILQQAERMGTLIDNVLESSRLMVRRQRLELTPLPLPEFLADYLERERPRVEARGVRLAEHLHTAATVLASEEALQRVLDNLLDNAARFSEPGGEVRIRVEDERDRVAIEVEDDGVGIPRSELKRIFDRFYQVRRAGAAASTGSGLGLSIVYGLVHEMGGEVQAFSQEGRPGARFRVELPKVEAA